MLTELKHICLAQIEIRPRQPEANTERMLSAIVAAKEAQADLIIFPELAVPGNVMDDSWNLPAFLRECEECGETIKKASEGIIIVFGNVAVNWQKKHIDGTERKYNALFIASNNLFYGPEGSPYPFVIKTQTHSFHRFNDSRYFFSLQQLAAELNLSPTVLNKPVIVNQQRLTCSLGIDYPDLADKPALLTALNKTASDIHINCRNTPFARNEQYRRQQCLMAQSSLIRKPLVDVNAVGLANNGKTLHVLAGGSAVYNQKPLCLPLLEAATPILPLQPETQLTAQLRGVKKTDDISDVCNALLAGIQSFLKQCGLERVVIGLSGGIDSAVVAALFRRSLPPENILAANLPSQYNSPTTIALARKIAANLGCLYTEVSIDQSVELTTKQLNRLTAASLDGTCRQELLLTPAMLENVQARDRAARILAALAAAFAGIFTCNANKSEITVGYTTLYADLGGALAVLGDLWKEDVYRLGDYLNREVYRKEIIPAACFTLKPSAELNTSQSVDKGWGDPLDYPYHDRLFAAWVERPERVGPEEILEWYLKGCLAKQLEYPGLIENLFPAAEDFIADLEQWWQLFQGIGSAKRVQAPPIMAVTAKAYGSGFRESQNRPWLSKRYHDLKKSILAQKTKPQQ